MQEFNYRQEFPLVISFYYKDSQGKLADFGFPAYDFKIFFWTTSKSEQYVASVNYVNGEARCVNCKRLGDKLVVVFDHHRLNPGDLHSEMVMNVPDDLYPDGLRKDVIHFHNRIRLIHGPTPSPTMAEVTAILPYIKGDKGADGRDFDWASMSEEDKTEFAKRVAENLEAEAPEIAEAEDIREDEFDEMFGKEGEEGEEEEDSEMVETTMRR